MTEKVKSSNISKANSDHFIIMHEKSHSALEAAEAVCQHQMERALLKRQWDVFATIKSHNQETTNKSKTRNRTWENW